MSYLFWAYALTWLILFSYTLVLGGRLSRLSRQVEVLKNKRPSSG